MLAQSAASALLRSAHDALRSSAITASMIRARELASRWPAVTALNFCVTAPASRPWREKPGGSGMSATSTAAVVAGAPPSGTGSCRASGRSARRRPRSRAAPSRRAPWDRSSARSRTGRGRTRRRASATAARKLKLWSAASREVGSMRPGSSFWRAQERHVRHRDPDVREPARRRRRARLDLRCSASPAATIAWPVARHGIGLDVGAHDVAVGRQRRGQRRQRLGVGEHRLAARTGSPTDRAGRSRRGGRASWPACRSAPPAHWRTILAAEMAPWRTASGVGARAPLSASACASCGASSPIRRPAIAGATKPETVTPSQSESRSISILERAR